MFADAPTTLLELTLIGAVGAVSYFSWRFLESLSSWLALLIAYLGVFAELGVICFVPSQGPVFFCFVALVCSLIGAKLHLLTGGKSESYPDAFHLLFLSTVTAIALGSKFVFGLFIAIVSAPGSPPIGVSTPPIVIGPAYLFVETMVVLTLASPMAIAFFLMLLRYFKPRPGIEVHETAQETP